ncbi:hypothetical protein [Mesobacillus foraminis]|nr:hypothetical protein [Mesobacillus foraminis]
MKRCLKIAKQALLKEDFGLQNDEVEREKLIQGEIYLSMNAFGGN